MIESGVPILKNAMRRAFSAVLIVCLLATPALAVASQLGGGSPESGLFGGDPLPGVRSVPGARPADQRFVTVRVASAGMDGHVIVPVLVELALERAAQWPRSPAVPVLRI